MDELTLRNTDRNSNQIIENDDSIIRRVLADIEHLMSMLSSELDQNNYSSEQQQLKIVPSLCSTTITNVTINDDNHQLIEHLRNRINRLEHERNVLLTSYQLLIKLLK